jgi:hypothetical protein
MPIRYIHFKQLVIVLPQQHHNLDNGKITDKFSYTQRRLSEVVHYNQLDTRIVDITLIV